MYRPVRRIATTGDGATSRMAPRPARRPMIVHMGGTLGMRHSREGLVPSEGLEGMLRNHAELHDLIGTVGWHEITSRDSASLGPEDWKTLARFIRRLVTSGEADGVLVLHGTDTLAYSAAALTFLLRSVPAPVVMTGAMLPLSDEQSEAAENIAGALMRLSEGADAGVHVYFHGRLMSGSRVTKHATSGDSVFVEKTARGSLAPFASGVPGTDIQFESELPRSPLVVVLTSFPGMRADWIANLCTASVQGIVLECYGSGTVPGDGREIAGVIRSLTDRGVVVVAVSQCPDGVLDLGRYGASHPLSAAGIVSAHNLTREAAFAKLYFLLGQGIPPEDVAFWMSVDLCGEFGAAT